MLIYLLDWIFMRLRTEGNVDVTCLYWEPPLCWMTGWIHPSLPSLKPYTESCRHTTGRTNNFNMFNWKSLVCYIVKQNVIITWLVAVQTVFKANLSWGKYFKSYMIITIMLKWVVIQTSEPDMFIQLCVMARMEHWRGLTFIHIKTLWNLDGQALKEPIMDGIIIILRPEPTIDSFRAGKPNLCHEEKARDKNCFGCL